MKRQSNESRKHSVSRTCLTCHAKKLGEPVTARDCLGFAECETCTKLNNNVVNQEEAAKAWSEWLTDMHERETKKAGVR